jgi:hypothetical protein
VAELNGQGVTVELPSGWDGRIIRRPEYGEAATAEGGAPAPPQATTHTVVHLATIPLPLSTGDFGSGAVENLGARDLLIVLFEYEQSSAGTKLFARQGLPRALDPNAFDPRVLQRRLPGQAGAQLFFTEAGRAFSLYVVLGRDENRTALVPIVNQVLETIRVSPR